MDAALNTERLTLTPMTLSDVDLSLELFTDPVVTRYALALSTEDQVREGMAEWVRRGGDGVIGIWCITITDTGEKIGTVALLPMPIETSDTDFRALELGVWPDDPIEVGFFLKPSAWGKGYATEACKGALEMAFDRSVLDEVVATCDAANTASRAVLLRSGFEYLGLRPTYGHEGPFFRIRKADWQAPAS